MKSKIASYIDEYKICKICGAPNTYIVTKHKQGIKKPRGTKNNISIQNEKVFITEEGPYKIWISDEILDIQNSIYTINAVKDYIFDQVIFRLGLVCSRCTLPDKDGDDRDDGLSPKKSIKMLTQSDDDEGKYSDTEPAFHYEAVFFVDVDQKTQNITSVVISSEWLENDEFSINKNYALSSTKVIKKQRSIRLPFIYDKDFKDFDFTKLLAISNLLK